MSNTLNSMSSTRRPIEPAIRSNIVQRYSKPIGPRVDLGKIKKKSSVKKIDDTQVKVKNPVLSPKSFKSVHPKIDKLLQFHMNQSYGTKIDNTSLYFDRLYSVLPSRELINTCQYIFFVRPDLNIYAADDKGGHKLLNISEKAKNSGYRAASCPKQDNYIRYMQYHYPNTLRSLTSQLEGEHDFIPFLVGRTESLQLPDFSIQDYSMTQPYTGYSLPYASHAKKSTTGGTFEATFREDKGYRVHKLFQTWLYYIDAVTTNKFEPKYKHIRHNKMDYASSVYVITCEEDAETIIYWAKYTGVFPTVNQNSNISFNLRGSVDNKVSISFDYFLVEPLDPYILVDFNKNAHVTNADSRPYVPVYNTVTLDTIKLKDPRSKEKKEYDKKKSGSNTQFRKSTPVVLGTGNGLVGAPYICKVDKEYKLRWKKIKDISGRS